MNQHMLHDHGVGLNQEACSYGRRAADKGGKSIIVVLQLFKFFCANRVDLVDPNGQKYICVVPAHPLAELFVGDDRQTTKCGAIQVFAIHNEAGYIVITVTRKKVMANLGKVACTEYVEFSFHGKMSR